MIYVYIYTIQCSKKTWQCLSVLNLPQGKHCFFWHKVFLCCAAPVVSPLSHQKKATTRLFYSAALHLQHVFALASFQTEMMIQLHHMSIIMSNKKVHEGKIWMRLPCTENQHISNQQKHWSLIGHKTISESIRVSCKLIWSKSNHLQLDHKNCDYHGVQFFFQPTRFVKKTYSDYNIPRHPPFFSPFLFRPKRCLAARAIPLWANPPANKLSSAATSVSTADHSQEPRTDRTNLCQVWNIAVLLWSP